MISILLALAAFLSWAGNPSAQQPPSPPAPAVTPANGLPDAGSSSSKPNARGIPSFLIVGTVFNEHAFAFPGVQVRIRRVGEKKFRWEQYTDSRGEFAVRVPPGFAYQVLIHVKKYADQTEDVNAKADVQQRLSIKLEPAPAKAGAKS